MEPSGAAVVPFIEPALDPHVTPLKRGYAFMCEDADDETCLENIMDFDVPRTPEPEDTQEVEALPTKIASPPELLFSPDRVASISSLATTELDEEPTTPDRLAIADREADVTQSVEKRASSTEEGRKPNLADVAQKMRMLQSTWGKDHDGAVVLAPASLVGGGIAQKTDVVQSRRDAGENVQGKHKKLLDAEDKKAEKAAAKAKAKPKAKAKGKAKAPPKKTDDVSDDGAAGRGHGRRSRR